MILFRFDRFFTIYFIYPFVKRIGSFKRIQIPILMYHSVSNTEGKCANPYYQTNTTPKVFSAHMKFLHENRYTVLNLADAVRYFSDPSMERKKSVVITFDDGFRDFYDNCFPVLQKYGFQASLFLSTGFIDSRRKKFMTRECLNWSEVRELHNAGMLIGSHTVTHPQMRELDGTAIEYEIKRSKEQIEDKIGNTVEAFSYPFAFPERDVKFLRDLRRMLKASGYKYGVSTRIGTNNKEEDLLFLRRIPVNSSDDTQFFTAKLSGGYDWLFRFQSFFKSIKSFEIIGRHLIG